MALAISAVPALFDDDAIERLSRESPGWKLELDSLGRLLVSPTFSDGGARDLEAGAQLHAYATRNGGKAFGSSTGFRLADGSVRAPDAAWISAERIAGLEPDARTKYWRIAPDVVVEILSESDSWPELLAKLDLYERCGCAYVVGIDPFANRAEIRGTPPAGLALDIDAIVQA